MKLAGLLPLFIAASAWLPAEETAQPPAAAPLASKPAAPPPAETRPARISPELVQQLSSVLPKYAPPAPVAAKPVDSDVLVLPKVTVTRKKRPRLTLTEEVMMTPKGFNEKLARENLSSLDRNLLNKFTLPAWTGAKSAEERAREDYRLKKNAELTQEALGLADVTEVVDPAQAKVIRDAVSKP